MPHRTASTIINIILIVNSIEITDSQTQLQREALISNALVNLNQWRDLRIKGAAMFQKLRGVHLSFLSL